MRHTTKHYELLVRYGKLPKRKLKAVYQLKPTDHNDYRDCREKVSVQAFSFGSRKACSRVFHEQFSVTGLEVNYIHDKQRKKDQAKVKIAQRSMREMKIAPCVECSGMLEDRIKWQSTT